MLRLEVYHRPVEIQILFSNFFHETFTKTEQTSNTVELTFLKLKEIKHYCLLQYYDLFIDNSHIVFLTDGCFDSLHDALLKVNTSFDTSNVLSLVSSLLSGLRSLLFSGINLFYLDLQNIAIRQNGYSLSNWGIYILFNSAEIAPLLLSFKKKSFLCGSRST